MKLMSTESLQTILDRQRAWAERAGVSLDESLRTFDLEQNLFQPLSRDAREEFSAGAGQELAGDMRSLRSSSALVCNVFDYWRGRDSTPIVRACGIEGSNARIQFEQQFPTGLRGTPPHLDVLLQGEEEIPIAIESKFTEPFTATHNEFRPSYFAKQEIWQGLESVEAYAIAIDAREIAPEYLGAAQLIKHTLGLQRAHGAKGFRLLYLWFDTGARDATAHRREIEHFTAAVVDDIEFVALSYQEMFGKLELMPDDSLYREYLIARYF
jgi:hypothetical protein